MSDSISGRAEVPSRLYLPKLPDPPATILDYLDQRYPRIGREEWERRIEQGSVSFEDGTAITVATPYRHGSTVLYYREVETEPIVPFEESIIYRDDRILVADKPHFLPVTPTGPYVNECLLARLARRTGLGELTPMHRLDLETAGLVLFSTRHETRHLYHRLFAANEIEKEYHAIGMIEGEIEQREWDVRSRIEQGEPWFTMRIVEGEPNAATRVMLLERRGDRGLFRLLPSTGKKHQLRLQMAWLGFPIVNDRIYPVASGSPTWDYTRPLQLLARKLAFRDPVSGAQREFESERTLSA